MIHVMYILDPNKLDSAMKERGYRSISALAKSLGLHRNTIHHLLSKESIFPESLEKIFEALRLKPEDVLVNQDQEKENKLALIFPFVDHMNGRFPQITWILFGSRARIKHHPYSDWDLGIYCSTGIDNKLSYKINEAKEDYDEQNKYFPFFIDITNLNRADNSFLTSISKDWQYLIGPRMGWHDLQNKIIK